MFYSSFQTKLKKVIAKMTFKQFLLTLKTPTKPLKISVGLFSSRLAYSGMNLVFYFLDVFQTFLGHPVLFPFIP